jgi:hypothetical protein
MLTASWRLMFPLSVSSTIKRWQRFSSGHFFKKDRPHPSCQPFPPGYLLRKKERKKERRRGRRRGRRGRRRVIHVVECSVLSLSLLFPSLLFPSLPFSSRLFPSLYVPREALRRLHLLPLHLQHPKVELGLQPSPQDVRERTVVVEAEGGR